MKDEDGQPRRLIADGHRDHPGARGAQRRRHLPRARQPQPARAAGRPVPLLRHAARRSERHLPARAPARAARARGVLRVAESRRGPQHQLARHARADGRPAVVRHHLLDFGSTLGSGSIAGAEPARRERVRLGIAADAHHHADARLVRAAVDQGSTYPRDPGGRPVRVHLLPAEDWKPDYPNPAFKNARAEDRFWAARIVAALHGRSGARRSWRRRDSPIRAPPTTSPRLCSERERKVLDAWLNGTNPIVNVALSAVRRADVRERSRAGRRRAGGRALHRAVVPFRQRHRARTRTFGGEETRHRSQRAGAG